MHANSLVHCIGMHELQRKPNNVMTEALDYLNLMCPLLEGPHRDRHFILNMDQMPVFFCMTQKKTLEVIGVKIVHIRTSTNNTKCATVAVSIAADSTVLPYRCQENAWMDERVMIAWVDKVLKPYVANAPDHIIPLIILDSYHCHMMALVVTRIQELGIEVKHVPGRCTSLCQPVNVGFNKPSKDRVQRQWMSWMITGGVIHGTTSLPMRHDVAGWVYQMMTEMKEEVGIIRNTWSKAGYKWFPKEGGQETKNDGVNN
jgi:hypothetical protein